MLSKTIAVVIPILSSQECVVFLFLKFPVWLSFKTVFVYSDVNVRLVAFRLAGTDCLKARKGDIAQVLVRQLL